MCSGIGWDGVQRAAGPQGAVLAQCTKTKQNKKTCPKPSPTERERET